MFNFTNLSGYIISLGVNLFCDANWCRLTRLKKAVL